MCAPDFNPILKLLGGRIRPLGLARALPAYLRWRGRRDACLIIMGVERGYQGRGIMRALLARLVVALRAGGYRALTVTWISEQKPAPRASILALGAHPYHRLTLHEAPISTLLESEP